MHTVELLEHALEVARRLGYEIRHEWLGGSGGGACHFKGRKWMFVDLALTAVEQLDQVMTALEADPGLYAVERPATLARLLERRRAA